MDRVALFLPNWVGDVVMATPAVRAVRAHFPAAGLVAVCKPYVADVTAGSPWFRDVILFDRHGPGDRRFWAAKHWPVEHFARLARMLAQRGCGVVVLCGPGEREIARRIADDSRSPHAFPLGDGPLSLGLTKAVVRRLDLLVTTDSGPRHFAAAFDRPVVTLFGPTYIAWTETYFAKAVHLQKQVPCGPCQQRVCPLGHHQCMRDLGVN